MAVSDVRLQTLDGQWEQCGKDRFPGVIPESVQVAANANGHDTCSFQLKRDPMLIHPDLSSFTPCEIEEDGTLIFEGRVQETPSRTGGDDEGISITGKGWQYHLDDDLLERNWVHSLLTDWVDVRGKVLADLNAFKVSGSVEAGNGQVSMGWATGADMQVGQRVGVTLDLREPDALRVVAELSTTNIVGSPFTVTCIGHDRDDGGASGGDTYWTVGGPGSGFRSGNAANPHRYVTIFVNRDNTPGASGSDHTVVLRQIMVFRKAAYESGNASILKATDVVADVLPYAPLLDQGADEIDAANTLFNIPDFAAQGSKTPREYIVAANAFHNYRWRVMPARKLGWGPYPTVPKFKLGDGGWSFEDASANSGEDVYNRCVIEGTGQDGSPVRVVRMRADRFSAWQASNPSFDVDASGWTAWSGALTRDTGVFSSSPASGRITTGALVGGVAIAETQASMGGTRVAGKLYTLRLVLRSTTDFLRAYVYLNANLPRTRTITASELSTTGFTTIDIPFTALDNQPYLDIYSFSAAATRNVLYVDDVQVLEGGSLADARQFTRTKVIQVSNPITQVAAQQIADVFLFAHQRSQLRGNLQVSPTGLRGYSTDEPIHPRRLMNEAGELIHLAHLIDPDTGAQGRDGVIAAVSSYDPDTELASVSIDNTRDNLDAVLARYGVVTAR